MPAPSGHRSYPMFRMFSLSELVDRVPYSDTYLLAVKRHHKPVTSRFRRNCSRALGMSEGRLFGSPYPSRPRSPSDPNA